MWLLALLSTLASAEDHVLAVVPFDAKVSRAELAPVAEGLAAMMLTDLGEAQAITMVERERVNALLAELDFQQSAFVDPATAQKIGRIVGASAMVTGQLSESGGTVRIDARVIDTATGKILVSTEQQGPADSVFSLERALALGVLEGLHVPISATHRERLGSTVTEGAQKVQPGSGFDDDGPSLTVTTKGRLWSSYLWVDGVQISHVRAKEPAVVRLKPGRHEVLLSDSEAVYLNCAGVLDIAQDTSWSIRELCSQLSFGEYGEYGTARRGGLLQIEVDTTGIFLDVEGPSKLVQRGLNNVIPGAYAISAEQSVTVQDGPYTKTIRKPICNIVVRVPPEQRTLVNIGLAGCAGG